MHSLFSFDLLMIVSSFLLLPNLLLVDARNLASNGYFSVDLIHRDSPLSPYYSPSGTQQTRQGRLALGSVSHHHRVSLSSSYYGSTKNVQTEIIPNGGDYLMKIAIGTPPVEYTAVADTGSDLVWVQCAPCQSCIKQDSPLFNLTKSSSYRSIPCNFESCNQQGIESGCQPSDTSNDGSCSYTTQYGDGTKSAGALNTETISFSSPATSFPNFIFGCGYDQQGDLGSHGAGIVGLGGGELSLVSQLSPNINYKFSYCLTPVSLGVNSKLSFGLGVTGPGVVSTPFTNQGATPTFYSLTLDGITVGDSSSVPVTKDVIIDSGTTLTYLPSDVYDGVKTALKDAIALTPVTDPNQVFDPCYDSESLGQGFNPPDVVFNFQGADVVLKAENIFRTVDNLACLAMVPTDDTPIFGNIAQVNFKIGYDLKEQQVSFAPADCTKN